MHTIVRVKDLDFGLLPPRNFMCLLFLIFHVSSLLFQYFPESRTHGFFLPVPLTALSFVWCEAGVLFVSADRSWNYHWRTPVSASVKWTPFNPPSQHIQYLPVSSWNVPAATVMWKSWEFQMLQPRDTATYPLCSGSTLVAQQLFRKPGPLQWAQHLTRFWQDAWLVTMA